jgi:hypothetical protein
LNLLLNFLESEGRISTADARGCTQMRSCARTVPGQIAAPRHW